MPKQLDYLALSISLRDSYKGGPLSSGCEMIMYAWWRSGRKYKEHKSLYVNIYDRSWEVNYCLIVNKGTSRYFLLSDCYLTETRSF